MVRIIDADSHFMEPLDLWERYIDPKFREQCLRFERDGENGGCTVVIGDLRIVHSAGLTIEELLGVAVGYGQKEDGQGLQSFDTTEAFDHSLEDMDSRIDFLNAQGIETVSYTHLRAHET